MQGGIEEATAELPMTKEEIEKKMRKVVKDGRKTL